LGALNSGRWHRLSPLTLFDGHILKKGEILMGVVIPPEVFQEYLVQQRSAEARQRRMTARTVLAEMVRQEVTERGLSWRRRRAMVRFAGKFGIEEYEAQLLIRAAEFSFGETPDASQHKLATEYLAALDEPARWHRFSAARWMTIAAVLFFNTMGLIWLLRR
jgi:hypothetical protein